MARATRPTFFASAAEFGSWLARHGARRTELVVGFWKVGSCKPSMTWPEASVEAITHGWIDGVRHSLDRDSYTVRFTPRRPTSTWSAVNIATAKRLIAEGRMSLAGRKAFEARRTDRSVTYSYERRKDPTLAAAEEARLRKDAKAWADFSARPPSYRKAVRWWIESAKKPETRARRLAQLIASSRAGRPVPPLRPRPGKRS